MRFTGIRLPLLAAVACASVGLSLSATDRSYGQAIYVYPASTTISLSTPYLLPRSYVVPSSYVFPRYIESSYTVDPAVSLLPTGYIETTYRRGLLGRRWIVERPVVASYATTYLPTTYLPSTYVSAYVPTTYVSPTYYATSYRVRRYRPTTYTYYPSAYYPTLYETAYTSPADICCDEAVVDSPVRSLPQSSALSAAPNRNSREIESRSSEDPSYEAYVNPPLPNETEKVRSTLQDDARTKAQTKNSTESAASPPNPPPADARDEAESKAALKGDAVQKNAATPKSGGASTPKSKAAVPTAPADGSDQIDLQPAPGNGETVRRDSMRPRYPNLRSVDRRNVLFGSVETEDGRPLGEVPVSVVNRNNRSFRRSGVSDAFGSFAIRVPDGQWSVRVTMPSGNIQTVRDITVTGGKIMDNLESKEVYNLIISY